MEDKNKSKYSAQGPLQGYIYQCRLALLEALKRLRADPCITVSIETIDDVVFDNNDGTKEILQIKHKNPTKAKLSDTSTDFWKTIRIWVDIYNQKLTQNDSIFCLITTESLANNSAAFYLRIENRDFVQAEKILSHTAETSKSDTNKEAYSEFLKLESKDREFLLKSVYILDNYPLSGGLQEQFASILYNSCPRNQLPTFIEHLEGWWFNMIVKSLSNHQPQKITGAEIDTKLDMLREDFRMDSLPIHDDINTANPDFESFEDRKFIKQLNLIEVGKSRMMRATRNFYMASEQRSRWVREDLLINNELEEYDEKLTEEWSIHFEQINDKVVETTKARELIESGKKVFEWVERDANIPIRKSFTHTFVTRGTYQILADQLKVGWHPEFKEKLSK